MAFLTSNPSLSRALAERNYTEATPVQDAVLADGNAGRDLLVSAQTGSGKTVAYGLAVGATLLGEAEQMGPAGAPLALVVAPTRELALQVDRELAWLYARTGARVVACVGGMDPRKESRRLADGAHIVVGTPGRLRDHLERGALNVGALKVVVLDEADEMLDLGFREDLEFILQATPGERQTLLFSATLPKTIVALARRYQRNAARIEVSGGEGGHADIEYRAVRVAPNEIEHAVVNVLRYVEAPSALVFCNTRESVRHLHAILLERGFAAVSLSGELSQADRNQALQALRDRRARVCVATDVAARGIDLPELGLVIHADLPHDPEVLQHRSGRTGRAGRKGISVLLVPISRRRKAEQLIAAAGVHAEWSGAPSAEAIRKLDHDRMLHDPVLTEEASEDDLAMAAALLADRSPNEVAAALVRLYRARLPSPEEIFDPGPGRAGGSSVHERDARKGAGREPRMRGDGDSVWFRLNVGRQNNADPRWLIPMLCRRGKITKAEIGSIQIFERETRFEIAAPAAEKFASAARRAGPDDIMIEPMREEVERSRGNPPARRPGGPQRPGKRERQRKGRTPA